LPLQAIGFGPEE